MREYELTVVYDLAVQEAGGPDASTERLTQLLSTRGAKLVKVDHWGRRRMAYPIKNAIDGDYLVTRVEAEPSAVTAIEAALGIDERVYRHLIVRADELPPPPPPREPRQAPAAAAPAPVAAAPASPEPVAAAEQAPAPEVAPPAEAEAAPPPAPEAAPPAEAEATPADDAPAATAE